MSAAWKSIYDVGAMRGRRNCTLPCTDAQAAVGNRFLHSSEAVHCAQGVFIHWFLAQGMR